MTNLEWIRTLSEEEFADWLHDEWLHHLQYRWSSSRGGLIIWLKDRKTENSSEKPNNCETCKWDCDKDVCGRCRSRNLYAPKTEPQTDEEQFCIEHKCTYYRPKEGGCTKNNGDCPFMERSEK